MINATNPENLLKNQALKRNGVYCPGFLFWHRQLRIISHQKKIVISLNDKKKPFTTNFECLLNLRRECDVYIGPQKYGGISVVVKEGTQDILIGDEAFDKSFIIQSRGLDVTAIISNNLKEKLLALHKLSPSLFINKDKLTFNIKEIVASEKDLSSFIDAGIEVLYQLRNL